MKDGESFRRELFFVNGRPYRQVYSTTALHKGCYFLDEERMMLETTDAMRRTTDVEVGYDEG